MPASARIFSNTRCCSAGCCGIGRLAGARPESLTGVDADIMAFLDSKDIVHRGLAAWTLGNLRSARAAASLPRMADDSAVLTIYDHENYLLTQTTVGALARTALSRINKVGNSE